VEAELERFYRLGKLMNRAFLDEEFELAQALAEEYLVLAARQQDDWNHGNALHDANMMLGLVALQNGNTAEAEARLASAAQTPGSPQLDSFGPSLELARRLLAHDRNEAVVLYLREIRRFWKLGRAGVDDWLEEIARGEQPVLHRFQASMPREMRLRQVPEGMMKPDLPC
jgi:hypothetical protein